MSKNNYIPELIISYINHCLLVPLMLLTIGLYDDPCNFVIWTGILYFIPLFIFMFLQTMLPNSSILASKFVMGSKYIIFKFIINTVLFLRLLFCKKEKNIYYWITFGIVILNYLMMILFMFVYMNIGSCNM